MNDPTQEPEPTQNPEERENDEERPRKGAEWAPEGTPAPADDPRRMTREDHLGTYAGDLLTWALEREEPLTREALADELVSRGLARTEDELDEYRRAQTRDVKAATASKREWIPVGQSSDPEQRRLSDAIAEGRITAVLEVLAELDGADMEEARERFGR